MVEWYLCIQVVDLFFDVAFPGGGLTLAGIDVLELWIDFLIGSQWSTHALSCIFELFAVLLKLLEISILRLRVFLIDLLPLSGLFVSLWIFIVFKWIFFVDFVHLRCLTFLVQISIILLAYYDGVLGW